MAIDTLRDLFFQQLGVTRDAERAGQSLFEFMALQVKNSDLVQILRTQQQNRERLENVSSCLQTLGASPIETPSEPVGGLRKRFDEFIHLQASPEMLDQFTVDTAIKFFYLAIAAYRRLVDWAILMGESRCAQFLYPNIARAEESASELERFGHELGARLLAPA